MLAICSCAPKEQPKAEEQLRTLTGIFNVVWPTNYSNAIAGEWTYRALLDGNSQNYERALRLDVPLSDFTLWREAVTNQLGELPKFRAREDPRMTKRFPWWDPHVYPQNEVILYHKELSSNNTYIADLEVYVIRRPEMTESSTNRRFWLVASPIR